MGGSDVSQFYELAPYYDAINDWKDYRREVDRLESLVRQLGAPPRASWLDVACGTGRHLEFLRRRHPVVGVDASRAMLRVARRRVPRDPLVLADMRTFRLDRQFDVVTCLFSAVGHLGSKSDVLRTYANFARHLNPGGVVVVEPWIDPSRFRPGTLHLRRHESPGLTIVRLAFSERRGNRSRIQYHFLVGRTGRGIRHYRVTDVGLLLARREHLELLRRAGFRPQFLSDGFLPGRGLLVGVKTGAGSGRPRDRGPSQRSQPLPTDSAGARPFWRTPPRTGVPRRRRRR